MTLARPGSKRRPRSTCQSGRAFSTSLTNIRGAGTRRPRVPEPRYHLQHPRSFASSETGPRFAEARRGPRCVRAVPRTRSPGDPGAPAHKFARANSFRGLAPPLRNFLRPELPSRVVAPSPERGCERNFRVSETKGKRNDRFRDGGRKSLKSLGREIRDFARAFVFNGLIVFLFRAVAACALSTQKRPRCGGSRSGRAR